MTRIDSQPRHIAHPVATVYGALSDMANAAAHADKLQGMMPGGMAITADSITVNVQPVGSVTLTIVERQEPTAIKYQASQSPVPFALWVRLTPDGADACQMTLEAEADLNPMLASMVRRPLTDGLERMAEAIAALPFDKI